tara:strand:- start:1141 stop:1518 length:378 start_codon:yes stop_codon:yes gene_type:complete
MKNIKYVLVLVFATIQAISCNSDDDSNSDVNDSALLGTWELTETFEGEELVVRVTFNANKTGISIYEYTFEGDTETETDNFTWSTNGNKLSITSSGETEVLTYSISGNKLTITDSFNDVSVFTKQ